jgi:uncharacterized protein (TIGR02147 family)
MNSERRSPLKDVFSHIKPSQYLDAAHFVEDVYQWVKARRKNYSYLEFADELGFSKTNVMHLVAKGKRRLSSKAADKIISVLHIKGPERMYFETLVRYQNARLPSERDALFERLTELKARCVASPLEQNQLEYFSEWFHSVIREMVALKGFKADPQWIVGHIEPRVLPEQARKSLALLEELGLVKLNEESGSLELTQTNVTTGDEIAHHAVVRYHQRNIEIGRESVMNFDHTERNVSSVTVAVSPEVFDQVADEISAFRKRILQLAEQCSDPDRVYQLNIQFFPYTKSFKE